jgi:hypothetical protein
MCLACRVMTPSWRHAIVAVSVSCLGCHCFITAQASECRAVNQLGTSFLVFSTIPNADTRSMQGDGPHANCHADEERRLPVRRRAGADPPRRQCPAQPGQPRRDCRQERYSCTSTCTSSFVSSRHPRLRVLASTMLPRTLVFTDLCKFLSICRPALWLLSCVMKTRSVTKTRFRFFHHITCVKVVVVCA